MPLFKEGKDVTVMKKTDKLVALYENIKTKLILK